MDLKDKWRNLVRQKIVNPDEFPSPEGRSRPRMSAGLEDGPGQDQEVLQNDPQGRHHLRLALPAPPGAHLVSHLHLHVAAGLHYSWGVLWEAVSFEEAAWSWAGLLIKGKSVQQQPSTALSSGR